LTGARIQKLARRLIVGRGRGERPAREGALTPTGDRVLVAGWFSWSAAAATAGDLMARDVACRWLDEAASPYDIANAPGFGSGVDWRTVDPADYSDVLFVCGPVGPAYSALNPLLQRFAGSRLLGLDLTMIEPVSRWNPFDMLFERDSARGSRPDLALVAAEPRVPVIGVVLVEPYAPEFPDRDRQDAARTAIEALVESRAAAWVRIDTRLDVNQTGLRSASEVESLIARMDAVVTTRLHGLVLAVKNGVPALAVDPVAGGSKVKRQAEAIGWTAVKTADQLHEADMSATLEFCLREEARRLARDCAERGAAELDRLRREFITVLKDKRGHPGSGGRRRS
jgi:Polysaccharide pyruvyl transferase